MQVTSADRATARSKQSEEEGPKRCGEKQLRRRFLQREAINVPTNQMESQKKKGRDFLQLNVDCHC